MIPVFVTYETPFTPCGGITAVMRFLPEHLSRVSGNRVLVFSPFHHRIPTLQELDTKIVGKIEVPFDGHPIALEIHLHRQGTEWYFLRARDDRFFQGDPHPYADGPNLLRDALLFGKGVSEALAFLDPSERCCLFLQDWEGVAPIFDKEFRESGHRFFLNLHNSYDKEVSDNDLLRCGFQPNDAPGSTMLERSIPLVEQQILTVSRQFAYDLCEEPWQRCVMVPHLQDLLKGKVTGIVNGPFQKLQVGEKTFRRGESADYSFLRRFKTLRRKKFVEVVRRTLVRESPEPVWGNPETLEPDRKPWFVMAGRDDPRQKGYDLAVDAIARYLESGKNGGRFFFFPLPGDGGLRSLSFLKEFAESYPNQVLVFPFRFREGLQLGLQASSFGLMPSYYEPFGMANEFYLNGTVGIARATGGLIEQIVPLKGKSFSDSVAEKTERALHLGWYGPEPEPTGILFREPNAVSNDEESWRRLNQTASDWGDHGSDLLGNRRQIELFREISRTLERALFEAAELYTTNTDCYYRMLVSGIKHILTRFSWESAAQEYLNLLE